jgi:hypothetical protein
MARRPPGSPEAQLATDAHRVGVLAYFSTAAQAAGKPHIRLFARGGNVTELSTIDQARDWLQLRQREQTS